MVYVVMLAMAHVADAGSKASGESFRDRLANGQPCPDCPEMVVIPAGSFIMGSPVNEPERAKEEAQVRVTIAVPFATLGMVARGQRAIAVAE
jgi:formylglycine-generating enzyme required for sulfatase activity